MASGLLACHLPVTGYGAIDMCGPNLAPLGDPPREQTTFGDGTALQTAATGFMQEVGSSHRLAVAAPVSIMWVGDVVGTGGDGSWIYGMTYDNAGGSPFGCYSFVTTQNGANIVLALYGNAAGTNFGIETSTVIPLGAHVMIGTLGSNGRILFDNGEILASSATAVTTINYSATSQFGSGMNPFGAGAPMMNMAMGAVWRRLLTHSEVRKLTADPFQFLKVAA